MLTSLEIQTRAVVLGGQPFGATGAYEKIAGTLRFAVDPAHPLHQRVTDIGLAPRVSGFVRCRMGPKGRAATLALADRCHIPNPTIDLDDPQAWITVREHGGAVAATVPRSAWRFSDAGHVELQGGFAPGAISDAVHRPPTPPP